MHIQCSFNLSLDHAESEMTAADLQDAQQYIYQSQGKQRPSSTPSCASKPEHIPDDRPATSPSNSGRSFEFNSMFKLIKSHMYNICKEHTNMSLLIELLQQIF